MMKSDVVIIGAGPAGLMLGHMLHQAGIDCVLLERQTPEYVRSRIRAGVLEQCTINVLERLGLDERCKREGLPHDDVILSDGARKIEIDVKGLTGKNVVVYGQTEITADLMNAAASRELRVLYEAADIEIQNITEDSPFVTCIIEGEPTRIDAKFIVGCDGFHGPCRPSIPASAASYVERVYPFGWLGILADVPPATHAVAYANHERGFALSSMRSNTRSRYYIQVDTDEDIDLWPDDRIWDELEIRLGPDIAANVTRGPSLEKSIAPLRSFIFERMRYGNLFLAGDAAHIVPPTGAKGLNLAASDVTYLFEALNSFFHEGSKDRVDNYESTALARVWKSSRFSWYLTSLMHRFPDEGQFGRKMQVAELDYVANSEAAQKVIAENYIGLPL